MRWAEAILALLVLASTAAGQEPAVPTQSTTPNPNAVCSVEGVVVKTTTGEALKKITVNLMSVPGDHPSLSDVTDGNGHFAFNEVEPGSYALAAGGNGYPQQGFGNKRGRPGGNVLTLTPGSHDKDLVIRMVPPGVITGTVRDEQGDAVIGGQVRALRVAHVGRRMPPSPGGSAQTNDLGQYRLYGLEPGQYFVIASYQPQNMGNMPSKDIYLPTFYPSTSDSGQAIPIKVSPGDEISGIDVDLKCVQSVVIRGRIVTEIPTKTRRGAYVSLMPRDAARTGYSGMNYGGVVHDDVGDFELDGVPHGSYVLFANLNDADHSYSGRALVEVGNANVEGLTLVVGSGVTLRGNVRLSAGAELDLTSLRVFLQAEENFMGGAGAQVKADGTFVLQNVSDGTYRVNVGGFPEEFYLQSVRLGGTDVLGPGPTLSHNDPVSNLDVVLSKEGGRVDGVVLNDQQPVGGAIVVFIPDPPNRDRNDLYSFKTTDPLGRFSLLGLPPGDFKLFAWDQREGLPYTDPDFMKEYEDRGTRVHIEDKKQQLVQLQVIPAIDDLP